MTNRNPKPPEWQPQRWTDMERQIINDTIDMIMTLMGTASDFVQTIEPIHTRFSIIAFIIANALYNAKEMGADEEKIMTFLDHTVKNVLKRMEEHQSDSEAPPESPCGDAAAPLKTDR